MIPDKPRIRGGSDYKEALHAGGCFALAALAPSFLILTLIGVNDSWRGLIVTSSVAAFIMGTLLWKLIFAGGRRPTLWRGVGVGALVGIVSHPPAWYLLFVWFFVTGERSSLGDRTLDPLSAIPASFFASLASVWVVGWMTSSVSAIVGGVLGLTADMGARGSAAPLGAGPAPDYSGIDYMLSAWAQRHGLQISTEHQGQGAKSIFVVGRSGKQYQIWIDAPDERNEIHVHAWDYEKMRADVVSSPYDLSGKLEEIYATVISWDASRHQ